MFGKQLRVELMSEKPATTYKRAISNIESKFCALLRMIFGKIFAYEKMFVLETVESKIYPKMAGKTEVHVRLVRDDDIPKLSRFKNLRGGEVEKRLNAGHLCFIAEKNRDIANYTWICFEECYVSELERTIRIEPDSAYRYDAYTAPKYRGKGILPIVLATMADYLFQNGIKAIYDLVSSDNFSSLRSYQKIRSRKMGEVTFMRLFNSKRYIYKAETTRDYGRLKEMLSL